MEKHINSSRFERICRSLSPYCLQHVLSTMVLGGLAAYCYVSLFHNFQDKSAFLFSWLVRQSLYLCLYVWLLIIPKKFIYFFLLPGYLQWMTLSNLLLLDMVVSLDWCLVWSTSFVICILLNFLLIRYYILLKIFMHIFFLWMYLFICFLLQPCKLITFHISSLVSQFLNHFFHKIVLFSCIEFSSPRCWSRQNLRTLHKNLFNKIDLFTKFPFNKTGPSTKFLLIK